MKWLLRSALGLLVILIVAGLFYHLGLRHWCLRWGATSAEVQATLPGDDLFPAYASDATHAITIHASPEKVWPKVERLVPAWNARVQGETVWFATPKRFGGQGRMIAAIVEPYRDFAMIMPNDWQSLQAGGRAHEGIWSFTLQPIEDGKTRLIARSRGRTPPTLAGRLAGRLFWEPAHFVMEQKMLRTIRDLAKRS